MKVTATDHMKYLDTMEAVDSDIMNKVLNAMEHYDYHRYTEADVRSACQGCPESGRFRRSALPGCFSSS